MSKTCEIYKFWTEIILSYFLKKTLGVGHRILGPVFYSGITGSAGTSNTSFKGKVGKGQHLVCDVCDVTVTSRVMMEAHLAGEVASESRTDIS